MIVYRTQQRTVKTSCCFEEIDTALRRLEDSPTCEHESAVDLLIRFGELETALTDILSTDANVASPTVAKLRQAGVVTGHILSCSWEGVGDRIGPLAARLRHWLETITTLPLPETVRVRIAEGYAYYGLYPETYLEAAKRFFDDHRPSQVVCIGIRSIGTSLSSVVAAALEERGCRVHPYTVRCQGHPFDRRLVLNTRLEEQFRAIADCPFLIADEGPGLSGSSFCGVAQKLVDLGVAEDRIIFFPSHDPRSAGFVSQLAQDRWPRHRKYVASFEDVWIKGGRLAQAMSADELTDLSGGQWRSLLYEDESDYPAVQPTHERRKYLVAPANSRPLMLKFVGLGSYGKSIHARVQLLADAGFHPPVLGLANGFLITEFIPVKPMSPADIDAPFLNDVARYLAFLRQAPCTAAPASHEEIVEMIAVNVEEGLGPEWSKKLAPSGLRIPTGNGPVGTVDGRMMLYEWLRTPTGTVKTDGVDHANDHFSPGCMDIAWDLAACAVEWRPDEAMQNYLIDRYYTLTGDRTIRRRLPFHTIAYLAHRLGYATLAAQTLGPHHPDGLRFQTLLPLYTQRLQLAIADLREL